MLQHQFQVPTLCTRAAKCHLNAGFASVLQDKLDLPMRKEDSFFLVFKRKSSSYTESKTQTTQTSFLFCPCLKRKKRLCQIFYLQLHFHFTVSSHDHLVNGLNGCNLLMTGTEGHWQAAPPCASSFPVNSTWSVCGVYSKSNCLVASEKHAIIA